MQSCSAIHRRNCSVVSNCSRTCWHNASAAPCRFCLRRQRRRLELACRSLDTISPLATLQRGYAIVSQLPERRILRQAATVKAGDRVEARLAEGTLVCTVDATENPQ